MTTTAPISVCIGTFGDTSHWSDLAQRALASVERQTVQPEHVVWRHDRSLHEARNGAAWETNSTWLCFLDADDELHPGYIEAMAAVLDHRDRLLQPSTLGVHPNGREDPQPVLIPTKPLLDGNYLVIGTLVRRSQFCTVGGFRELPMYEDWDLWIRCWLDGATVEQVPEAIYRVHVNTQGRNSSTRAQQLRTYREIRERYRTDAVRH